LKTAKWLFGATTIRCGPHDPHGVDDVQEVNGEAATRSLVKVTRHLLVKFLPADLPFCSHAEER
jgi:hypothetical protein